MGGVMDSYAFLVMLCGFVAVFIAVVTWFFGEESFNIECQMDIKKKYGEKVKCPFCNSRQIEVHKVLRDFEFDCCKCLRSWSFADDGMVIELCP